MEERNNRYSQRSAHDGQTTTIWMQLLVLAGIRLVDSTMVRIQIQLRDAEAFEQMFSLNAVLCGTGKRRLRSSGRFAGSSSAHQWLRLVVADRGQLDFGNSMSSVPR